MQTKAYMIFKKKKRSISASTCTPRGLLEAGVLEL